jgi:hypothetical protein
VTRRSAVFWVLLWVLSYAPFASAAPPTLAQTEVDYLLTAVERSGCRFYRNGNWYDGSQAQAHLRHKYDALVAMNRIASAEDFIELAASKSSLSGKAYAIMCNNGPAVASAQWLRDALARYRSGAG